MEQFYKFLVHNYLKPDEEFQANALNSSLIGGMERKIWNLWSLSEVMDL